MVKIIMSFIFFFNDTATTEIYTLSLHDALPISCCDDMSFLRPGPKHKCCTRSCTRIGFVICRRNDPPLLCAFAPLREIHLDRKSTRLNSSHSQISYAVFCLKKKKKTKRKVSVAC